MKSNYDQTKDDQKNNKKIESIDLGLDRINFYFDENNIIVRAKFDAMIKKLCTIENKEF